MRAGSCETVCTIIAALLVIATLAGSASGHSVTSQALVIRGATLIDGNGGPPLANATVVVADGRIADVGPSDQIEVPAGAQVQDVPGHYLMPGLIDHHAHVLVPTYEQTADGPRFAGFDWTLSTWLVRALLRFGITTARSPSTPTKLGVAMRDSVASGAIVGPWLLVSGEYINDAKLSPEQIREEIRLQIAEGVDYVKLYQRLGPDAVRAGIAEAHAHGVPVIGHVRRTTWSEAIEMGIDFLTHGAPWTDEMLRAEDRERYAKARRERGGMRARIDWLEMVDPCGPEVGAVIELLADFGVPLDPTLVAYDTKFSYDTENGRPVAPRYRENENLHAVRGLPAVWAVSGSNTNDWTAEDFKRMEAAWPKFLALVKRYHEEGVLLTAGSDTPNPWVIPGESLHRELELLEDAGIPPGEVLRIATRNGAEALGMLEITGTVEAGKRADLVLLSANPLDDIANTRRIVWVMRGGERYRPEDLH